jgi:lauroyl/myristoyl acyltransferase
MQIDQGARNYSLFVPYFRKLEPNHSGPATLDLSSKCPVIMMHALLIRPRSYNYTVLQANWSFPPLDGIPMQAFLKWTRLRTKDVEAIARRFPEQVL